MKQELKLYESVQIAFQISAEANKFISESCSRSGRTKRKEAQIRLEDHLLKYGSISEINKSQERI